MIGPIFSSGKNSSQDRVAQILKGPLSPLVFDVFALRAM
jgi:hypothetical protein